MTEGSTEEYQKRLTAASREKRGLTLPVDINTRAREAAPLWADTLFSAFLKKAKALRDGRYNLDHLLLYDLTGPGLLVPLELGAPLLKAKLEDWLTGENPSHRFGRISVLRDLALLLDVGGRSQVLRGRSQRFRLPVLRARDEEDLKRRLRELDLYCRQSFIRHLRAFGSILGNLDELADDNGLGLPVFREESDLDLLVELEPGTRVTLLDMARMERELGDLIGFKVDLRTAEDLSRYFRAEVQREAVELRATA